MNPKKYYFENLEGNSGRGSGKKIAFDPRKAKTGQKKPEKVLSEESEDTNSYKHFF